MHVVDLFALAAATCLVAGAVCDVRRFEIPDVLSIGLVAAAVAYGLATPGFAWGWHAASIAIVFAVGLLGFSRGWFGGGDVKLLTGVAAWAPLQLLLLQVTAVALAGGVLALIVLSARGGMRLAHRDAALPRVFQPGAPMPYAVAIAGGALWWAALVYPVG